jgi:hypothetical protein
MIIPANLQLDHPRFGLPNMGDFQKTLCLPPEKELTGESTEGDTGPTAFHT